MVRSTDLLQIKPYIHSMFEDWFKCFFFLPKYLPDLSHVLPVPRTFMRAVRLSLVGFFLNLTLLCTHACHHCPVSVAKLEIKWQIASNSCETAKALNLAFFGLLALITNTRAPLSSRSNHLCDQGSYWRFVRDGSTYTYGLFKKKKKRSKYNYISYMYLLFEIGHRWLKRWLSESVFLMAGTQITPYILCKCTT